ncbi:uncharacterized protein LOC142227239 [Haematobia irritans]|uniref:uncharacterized protein LOC142227239 n=1 Tax=Haematobia irritans TaxID=7368 RepID=UPI003F4F6486
MFFLVYLIVLSVIGINTQSFEVEETLPEVEGGAELKSEPWRPKRQPNYDYIHYLIDKQASCADQYVAPIKEEKNPLNPYEMLVYPYGIPSTEATFNPKEEYNQEWNWIPRYYNPVLTAIYPTTKPLGVVSSKWLGFTNPPIAGYSSKCGTYGCKNKSRHKSQIKSSSSKKSKENQEKTFKVQLDKVYDEEKTESPIVKPQESAKQNSSQVVTVNVNIGGYGSSQDIKPLDHSNNGKSNYQAQSENAMSSERLGSLESWIRDENPNSNLKTKGNTGKDNRNGKKQDSDPIEDQNPHISSLYFSNSYYPIEESSNSAEYQKTEDKKLNMGYSKSLFDYKKSDGSSGYSKKTSKVSSPHDALETSRGRNMGSSLTTVKDSPHSEYWEKINSKGDHTSRTHINKKKTKSSDILSVEKSKPRTYSSQQTPSLYELSQEIQTFYKAEKDHSHNETPGESDKTSNNSTLSKTTLYVKENKSGQERSELWNKKSDSSHTDTSEKISKTISQTTYDKNVNSNRESSDILGTDKNSNGNYETSNESKMSETSGYFSAKPATVNTNIEFHLDPEHTSSQETQEFLIKSLKSQEFSHSRPSLKAHHSNMDINLSIEQQESKYPKTKLKDQPIASMVLSQDRDYNSMEQKNLIKSNTLESSSEESNMRTVQEDQSSSRSSLEQAIPSDESLLNGHPKRKNTGDINTMGLTNNGKFEIIKIHEDISKSRPGSVREELDKFFEEYNKSQRRKEFKGKEVALKSSSKIMGEQKTTNISEKSRENTKEQDYEDSGVNTSTNNNSGHGRKDKLSLASLVHKESQNTLHNGRNRKEKTVGESSSSNNINLQELLGSTSDSESIETERNSQEIFKVFSTSNKDKADSSYTQMSSNFKTKSSTQVVKISSTSNQDNIRANNNNEVQRMQNSSQANLEDASKKISNSSKQPNESTASNSETQAEVKFATFSTNNSGGSVKHIPQIKDKDDTLKYVSLAGRSQEDKDVTDITELEQAVDLSKVTVSKQEESSKEKLSNFSTTQPSLEIEEQTNVSGGNIIEDTKRIQKKSMAPTSFTTDSNSQEIQNKLQTQTSSTNKKLDDIIPEINTVKFFTFAQSKNPEDNSMLNEEINKFSQSQIQSSTDNLSPTSISSDPGNSLQGEVKIIAISIKSPIQNPNVPNSNIESNNHETKSKAIQNTQMVSETSLDSGETFSSISNYQAIPNPPDSKLVRRGFIGVLSNSKQDMRNKDFTLESTTTKPRSQDRRRIKNKFVHYIEIPNHRDHRIEPILSKIYAGPRQITHTPPTFYFHRIEPRPKTMEELRPFMSEDFEDVEEHSPSISKECLDYDCIYEDEINMKLKPNFPELINFKVSLT